MLAKLHSAAEGRTGTKGPHGATQLLQELAMQLRSITSGASCDRAGELLQDMARSCVKSTGGLEDHRLKANPLPFTDNGSLQALGLHSGIGCSCNPTSLARLE